MITKETAKGIIDAISTYEACKKAVDVLQKTKGPLELMVYERDEEGKSIRHVVKIETGIAIDALLKQLAILGERCDGMNDRARVEVMS